MSGQRIDPRAFPLLDHMTSGLLAIDRDNRIALWNRQMEQWSGLEREDMLGRDLFEAFPHLAGDEFRFRIEQVQRGGAPVILPPHPQHPFIPCPDHEGNMRMHRLTISWLPEHRLCLFCVDDQSEQFHLIGQQRQILDELRRELQERRELEERNAHLLAAIDQAGEAIIITSRTGEIEYVNRAFYRQTGWNEQETRAIAVYDALFAKHSDEFEQHLQAVFRDGLSWQGRQEIIRRDGSVFTASMSIAPIVNDGGAITHAIIIQEDISSLLKLESRLRETQKQEALVTLVGGIAHDFNNILAGITGQTYLASREVAGLPKTAERMATLQKLAQEASEIVAQLLTFARQGKVNAREMPLNSFLKEFCKLATHDIPESIELVTNIPSGRFPFRGDANQLQQALLNVVNNAVEACRDRKDARIEIALQIVDPDTDRRWIERFPVLGRGCFAHLSIRDNGRGMDRETQERIFDPFFTTKQLGSGLGLAMVQGCIRHHHGLIDVESMPGKGSTFHIFLPLRETETRATEKPSRLASAGLDILLVDDDPRVLEPTRELLETMGHRVCTAGNGEQALEIFRQDCARWDMLITDMVMPKMNGLESSKRMREKRPDLPIIYATGYDQSLVLEDTRRIPNSVLLSKPFNPDELDGLIRRLGPGRRAAETR